MRSVMLSRCCPDDTVFAAAIDRADLFIRYVHDLFEGLPWLVRGPVKAALLSLAQLGGLGSLDILDAGSWSNRGFDLSKGISLWSNAETNVTILFGVRNQQLVEELMRSFWGALQWSLNRKENDFLAVHNKQGELVLSYCFSRGYCLIISDEPVDAALGARKHEVEKTLDSSYCPEFIEKVLDGLCAPVHSLVVWIKDITDTERHAQENDENPRSDLISGLKTGALCITPESKTLRLDLVAPKDDELRQNLQCFCAPTKTAARVQKGALAVYSGLDLGYFVNDMQNKEDFAIDNPRKLSGVSTLVLHDIEPHLGRLLNAKTSFDDVLKSNAIHATLWMVSDNALEWRDVFEKLVEKERGTITKQGGRPIYFVPLSETIKEGLWAMIVDPAVLGATSEKLLEKTRYAQRGASDDFSDVLDPDVRKRLVAGEPLVYLKIGALAERFDSVVTALWQEKDWLKGFGVREVSQLLRYIQDASAQLKLDDPSWTRFWFKVRLAP